MIKNIFIIIIILFSFNPTNAEEYYYYGNGNKIYLSKSEKFISVQFDSNNLLEIEDAVNLAGFQLKQNIKPEKNIMLLMHPPMAGYQAVFIFIVYMPEILCPQIRCF